MAATERDKIAPRLWHYYQRIKKDVTGVHEFVRGNIREIEAAAQAGGRLNYPTAFAARANWLAAKAIVELMDERTDALDLLYQAVYYDEASLRCLGILI